MARWLSLATFALVLGCAPVWWALARWNALPTAALVGGVVELPKGATANELLNLLVAQQGLEVSPWTFTAYVRLNGLDGQFRAGEYQIAEGEHLGALLERILRGDVLARNVTLVEGWRFKEMLAAIHAAKRLEPTLSGLSEEQIRARLAITEPGLEGVFLPDTYRYIAGETDVHILEVAYRSMRTVLADEWARKADGLPLQHPYEALILASIVEKETGRAEDRSLISGVFNERLRRGMKLQTDPTVIYALGDEFDGNLRRPDLGLDHAYNTYMYPGLPPTPIAAPGRAAIHAALHPTSNQYLYFVARGDGTSEFSSTLDEHNRAVRRYQLSSPAKARE